VIGGGGGCGEKLALFSAFVFLSLAFPTMHRRNSETHRKRKESLSLHFAFGRDKTNVLIYISPYRVVHQQRKIRKGVLPFDGADNGCGHGKKSELAAGN
jgi:hypothetical protein